MRCANCGGELPGPTRFCPHCSAPQPGFEDVADAASVATAPGERGRWIASHLFAMLVFVLAAIVVFAVLAIALGWIGKDLLGL